MQAWIEESLKNGELFFYIVPAVLLLLLLIVIFWHKKKKEKKEETEEDEIDKLIKADKKLKAEIEPIVENTEEPPFKEAGAEIQLFEEQKSEPEPESVPAPVETSPETSPEPEKPAEPEKTEEPESVETSPETSPEPEKPAEPAPVETLPETSPEPEKPAATIKSGLEKTKKGGFMSRLIGLFKNSVVDDDLIEEHQHGWQYEHYYQTAYDGSSGHEERHGTDNINIRIYRNADGCGEESQCADADGSHGLRMCDLDGFFRDQAGVTFSFIPGGHEYRVVNGGP